MWRSAFIAVPQGSWRNAVWVRKRIRTRRMAFGGTNRCSPSSMAPRSRGAWRRDRVPACASREWGMKWILEMALCRRAPAVRRLPASASMPASSSLLETACGWSGLHVYADLRISDIMRTPELCGPPGSLLCGDQGLVTSELRITVDGRSEAMSRSGGRNLPGRRVGIFNAASASSFSVGSDCR